MLSLSTVNHHDHQLIVFIDSPPFPSIAHLPTLQDVRKKQNSSDHCSLFLVKACTALTDGAVYYIRLWSWTIRFMKCTSVDPSSFKMYHLLILLQNGCTNQKVNVMFPDSSLRVSSLLELLKTRFYGEFTLRSITKFVSIRKWTNYARFL